MNEYSSAIIHTPADNRRYLMQLRDYNPRNYRGYFSLFGGSREEGESPEQTIRRELHEETNLYDIADERQMNPLGRIDYDWDRVLERVCGEIINAYPKISEVPAVTGVEMDKLEIKLMGVTNHVFEYSIDEVVIDNVKIFEGALSRLYEPSECAGMMIAPNDRLALLHHFAMNGIKL